VGPIDAIAKSAHIRSAIRRALAAVLSGPFSSCLTGDGGSGQKTQNGFQGAAGRRPLTVSMGIRLRSAIPRTRFYENKIFAFVEITQKPNI
jgi:hypothetical protein